MTVNQPLDRFIRATSLYNGEVALLSFYMEVASLASRVGTSNGPDGLDIASAMDAFEVANNCTIAVQMAVVLVDGKPEMELRTVATEGRSTKQAAVPLVLSSAICLASKYKSLDSAVFHQLYVLDFQLALLEWETAEPKKA